MTGPDPEVGCWWPGDRAKVRLPDGTETRGEVVVGGDHKLYFRIARNGSMKLVSVDEADASFLWR